MHDAMLRCAAGQISNASLCAVVPESTVRSYVGLLSCVCFASFRVIHGLDVLDAFEKVPVDAKDRPTHEIKIIKITIHANPIAEAQR